MGLIAKINHFTHEHKLILKDPDEPYECDGCKIPGFGLCYVCEHKECNFCLHQQCANASSSAYQSFFPNCTLKFHPKAPQLGERYCDACGRDILGFVYQCNHNCPHEFHPCCLKLQHTMTEDGVTVYLKEKLTSKCLKCKSKEIAKGVSGWCYVSSCGKCRYHVACMEDLMMESWKKRQAGKTNMATSSCLELQSFNSIREMGRPSAGESSIKASKLWKMVKTMMLMVTAIFGDPTFLIIGLAQLLYSNRCLVTLELL